MSASRIGQVRPEPRRSAIRRVIRTRQPSRTFSRWLRHALTFLAVQQGLFGVLLGGAFAPNHKGMAIVPAEARIDFLRRQVLMSHNIRGGRFTDFAMGGLNYQIEHHLFPNMPRAYLRAAQPLVEAFCAEQGLTYTRTSLAASYGILLRYLNTMGLRAREPFTWPLVQQYRA